MLEHVSVNKTTPWNCTNCAAFENNLKHNRPRILIREVTAPLRNVMAIMAIVLRLGIRQQVFISSFGAMKGHKPRSNLELQKSEKYPKNNETFAFYSTCCASSALEDESSFVDDCEWRCHGRKVAGKRHDVQRCSLVLGKTKVRKSLFSAPGGRRGVSLTVIGWRVK